MGTVSYTGTVEGLETVRSLETGITAETQETTISRGIDETQKSKKFIGLLGAIAQPHPKSASRMVTDPAQAREIDRLTSTKTGASIATVVSRRLISPTTVLRHNRRPSPFQIALCRQLGMGLSGKGVICLAKIEHNLPAALERWGKGRMAGTPTNGRISRDYRLREASIDR